MEQDQACDPRSNAAPKRGPKRKSPTVKLTSTILRLEAAVKATDVTAADPDEAEALVDALRLLATSTRALHAAARRRYVVAED